MSDMIISNASGISRFNVPGITVAPEEFRRGRQIISADEAARRADSLCSPIDPGIRWGGVTIPSARATTHFCAVGATGSGKTMLLRMLMQSVLLRIGAKEADVDVIELEAKVEKYVADKERLEFLLSDATSKHHAITAKYGVMIRIQESIKKRETAFESVGLQYKVKPLGNQDQEWWQIDKRDIYKTSIDPDDRSLTRNACAYLYAMDEVEKDYLDMVEHIVNDKNSCYNLDEWDFKIISRRLQYVLSGNYTKIELLRDKEYLFHLLERLISDKNCDERSFSGSLSRFIKKKVEEAHQLREQIDDLEHQFVQLLEANYKMDAYIANRLDPLSGQHRALIYDAKGDAFSVLQGMKQVGLHCPVVILNPFDERGVAWDIAADINNAAAAERVAAILIPEDKNPSQPFFANAARDILAQVMVVFMTIKPGEWTFRDVLLAMGAKSRLVELLRKTPETEDLIELYFSDERTANNVMSEIRSRTAKYQVVAAMWHKAKEKVSLEHWLNNEYILVLGRMKKYETSLDPINRVLFERIVDLILSPEHTNSTTRRTWFFLDEVRNAGNLESLGKLLTEGRSKGACVVLGFQNLEGMHDAFGKERANELIGQCAHKAFLCLHDSETAEWASRLFGKYEFIESETGENRGINRTLGSTETRGESRGQTDTRGTTTGTTQGATRGTTTGVTSGVSVGTSSGSSFGSSGGGSEGTSFGSSGGAGNFSSSVQESWQRSRQETEQRSQQVSEQQSKQVSEQVSEQSSRQNSESSAFQTSAQTSTARSQSDGMSLAYTVNRKRMEKDAILSSQFMALPETNPANGLHGYYLVPSVGAFYGVLPGVLVDRLLVAPDPDAPNYVGRSDQHQKLDRWVEPELLALGLPLSLLPSAPAVTPPLQVTKKEESTKGGQQSPRTLRTNLRWLPGSDPDNGLIRE